MMLLFLLLLFFPPYGSFCAHTMIYTSIFLAWFSYCNKWSWCFSHLILWYIFIYCIFVGRVFVCSRILLAADNKIALNKFNVFHPTFHLSKFFESILIFLLCTTSLKSTVSHFFLLQSSQYGLIVIFQIFFQRKISTNTLCICIRYEKEIVLGDDDWFFFYFFDFLTILVNMCK